MNLDWLIVGGGIHGVHIAVRLLHEGDVDPERLRIVDPGPRLLDVWRQRTAVTGMAYLRSPLMHHVDAHPYALQSFASTYFRGDPDVLTPPNDRPSLGLFDAHCDHVLERAELATKHVRDRVDSIEIDEHGASVRLAGGGDLRAERVVLAIGAGDEVSWPSWAPRNHPRIQHVFHADPSRGAPGDRPVGVIGGGLTAAQVTLRLVRQRHRVALISRYPLRTAQYDTAPGWLGPKFMRGYARIGDVERRRSIITRVRAHGSMPSDVRQSLRTAEKRGCVTLSVASVERLQDIGDGFRLSLSDEGQVEVDRLVLATGLRRERPGGALLDGLVASASLPCAPCGFPIVDEALRWGSRLHVTASLAELELGPAARNIAGARRAGERILDALRAEAKRRATSRGRVRSR
ncbi:MAG: FAD/NAD(P)-binding protein [Planctomycetota bacterium]